MFGEFLDTHDLGALLCSPGDFRPFPRRQDRAAWEALSSDVRGQLVAWGEEALAGYPMLTATQFLAFCRNGSRSVYEQPYFERRTKLMGAILAECAQDDGRFVDAVIDGLWCVCEETTWVISAHNGSDHRGQRPMNERMLPDVSNPYVDLFAAQTAATLAYALYFLSDKLDAVSPLIARRVRMEVERRIFTPFMTHDDFWWMGMIRQNVNNWTPWILSNVMDCALLLERDPLRRNEIIARAMRMLDSYLAVMPADGGCDEGAAYFNMAGASLLDCLELLYGASQGRIDFYHEEHIKNIGAYPEKVHISGEYFLNFADCDAKPRLDGERLYRYGKRTGNERLKALGAAIQHGNSRVKPCDTPQLNRVLYALFAQIPEAAMPPVRPFMSLPDLQVFAWNQEGLYMAIKGGHNDESHNHNDAGSFVVYVDGEPQIVDMGNKIYTALTFGPQRYTLDNTRSRNHNVPLIGGVEQAAGRAFSARDVVGGEHGASMQLRMAYPAQAELCDFTRELHVLERGMEIRDSIGVMSPKPISWVFMLREKPEITAGCAALSRLCLRFDSALEARVSEYPVTDARMARNFPGSLYRLTLSAPQATEHKQTFILTRR